MYSSSAGHMDGIGTTDSICSDPPSPRLKPNSCTLINKHDDCDDDSVNHPDSSNSGANDPDYKQC